MNATLDIPTPHGSEHPAHSDNGLELRSGDGHRARRDVATGEVRPDHKMIRVVVGPDGALVPDITAKLPGRGAWVGADRASVEHAIKTKAFNRSFKGQVKVPEGFADEIARLLKRRALGLISMGLKGGRIAIGYDQVRALARKDVLRWRIEASDGSADGRSKIRTLSKAIAMELEAPLPRVLGLFSAAELGQAAGRGHLVHAAISPGPLAKSFTQVMDKLAGFEALIPADWPDLAHEDNSRAAVEPRTNGATRRHD